MSGPGKVVWQDREIRFDSSTTETACRPGEFVIDHLPNVEDTKGNNGEAGELSVTNLRMVWNQKGRPRTNLSIGYNCILNISIKTAQSKLRGTTQALYVLTKFNSTRFEFIFTHLVPHSPRLFTTVIAVHKGYQSTTLYRELKLRGAIIRDNQLDLLPKEEVFEKIGGVWNLSSEQGNLGTFHITNVRLVWHANMASNFNVSIPYFQMRSIRIRDSRFGMALVVETSPGSGGFVLGFRVDPASQLQSVVHQVKNLFNIYSAKPIFGIEHEMQEVPLPIEQRTISRQVDDLEITGDDDAGEDPFAVYYAEAGKDKDRQPEFDSHLGLAVESMNEGVTVKDLWNVLPK